MERESLQVIEAKLDDLSDHAESFLQSDDNDTSRLMNSSRVNGIKIDV